MAAIAIEKRYLSLGQEKLSVFPIGLGTALFGSTIPADDAFSIMDCYIEQGGNYIDTAHVYADWMPEGKGASEKTVGRWLAQSGLQDQVILGTKGGHPPINDFSVSRIKPELIKQDLEESLERLQVDHIDLYWLHRDDASVGVDELIDALNDAIDEGKISAFGGSNWTGQRLHEANVYAHKNGKAGFIASQPAWSLASARPEVQGSMGGCLYMTKDELDFYEQNKQMVVFAWSAQGGGFFSPRLNWFDEDRSEEIPDHLISTYKTEANMKKVKILQKMSDTSDQTVGELALSWLLNHRVSPVALIGPKSVEQLRSSLRSLEYNWEGEDWHRLDLLHSDKDFG